jgi:hypothetical protein
LNKDENRRVVLNKDENVACLLLVS